MSVFKRAWLYIIRKRRRSILLLVIEYILVPVSGRIGSMYPATMK